MSKKIVIFGDSYSTFEGHIPVGYDPYYSEEGIVPDCPVSKMHLEQTWWHRLISATGAELVLNNSWSGSTFSYTGYNGDCSTTSSFIRRFRQLKENGFFKENKIDTVLVFGGTNDSWVPAPLGEVKYSGWDEEDFKCARPAICYLMDAMKRELEGAKIIFIAKHFGERRIPRDLSR